MVGVGLLPWVAAFVLARLFAPLRIELVTSLIDAAVGAAVFLAALAFILPSALERPAETGPASPARRRALLGTAAVAAAVAIVSLPLSRIAAVGSGGLGNIATAARRLRTRADIPAANPAVDALPGITPRITANEDHYTVDTTLVKPRVDIATWKLDVSGAVEAPFSLTYDELLDLDAIEQVHTLECISNPTGGELISTAVWTGTRMRDLLQRARPTAKAYDVVLTSVDGYTDSFPIAKAMEPETLLVYLMNGKTLPQDHGYPVRVLVPNIYGMKNVKWLQQIKVETFDFKGYWQEQGWSDSAIINTNTRIDIPTNRSVRWDGGTVPIVGIAFAGARGIKSVQVSVDDGKTWNEATLEAAPGPLTWVRWVYRWTPDGPGTRTIRARATDGKGDMQTPVRRDPYPDGATGYDLIDVNVIKI